MQRDYLISLKKRVKRTYNTKKIDNLFNKDCLHTWLILTQYNIIVNTPSWDLACIHGSYWNIDRLTCKALMRVPDDRSWYGQHLKSSVMKLCRLFSTVIADRFKEYPFLCIYNIFKIKLQSVCVIEGLLTSMLFTNNPASDIPQDILFLRKFWNDVVNFTIISKIYNISAFSSEKSAHDRFRIQHRSNGNRGFTYRWNSRLYKRAHRRGYYNSIG